METTGNKIKRIRKANNLSLMQLAKTLNVSDMTLYKIETGKTKSITIEIGIGIAKALGVPFNELFEIAGSNPAIEKIQSELNDQKLIVNEKTEIIEEKNLLIRSLVSQNKKLKNSLIVNIDMSYMFEYERLRKDIQNCNSDDERGKINEKLNDLFEQEEWEFKRLTEDGTFDKNDVIEHFEEVRIRYKNNNAFSKPNRMSGFTPFWPFYLLNKLTEEEKSL